MIQYTLQVSRSQLLRTQNDKQHAWLVSMVSAAAMRASSMSGLAVEVPCPASLVGLWVVSCRTKLSRESVDGEVLIAAAAEQWGGPGTTVWHAKCDISAT